MPLDDLGSESGRNLPVKDSGPCSVHDFDKRLLVAHSVTANLLDDILFPGFPDRLFECCIDGFAAAGDAVVSGVEVVVLVHRAALEDFAPGRKGTLPAPGEERSKLAESMTKELTAAADAGHMYLDHASDVYRPTWKGAFLMTWKCILPGTAILRARMRRKVAPILSQVRASQPQ